MSEASNGNGNGNGTPPLRTVRDGTLSASIWERQGEDGPFYNTKIVRNWQDKDGQWHESSSFSEGDLRRLPDLARNSGDIIAAQRYQNAVIERAQEPPLPFAQPGEDGGVQKAAYQQKRKGAKAEGEQAPKQKLAP